MGGPARELLIRVPRAPVDGATVDGTRPDVRGWEIGGTGSFVSVDGTIEVWVVDDLGRLAPRIIDHDGADMLSGDATRKGNLVLTLELVLTEERIHVDTKRSIDFICVSISSLIWRPPVAASPITITTCR